MTDPTAAGAAINNNDHTNCPTCGSCPTCGRPYHYRPYVSPYFPPSPPWQQPHPWRPNVTWCANRANATATLPPGVSFVVHSR